VRNDEIKSLGQSHLSISIDHQATVVSVDM